MEIREKLIRSLKGERVVHPAYVVFDAFCQNKKVDWEYLFSLGLGELHHVSVTRAVRPHCEIVETISRKGELGRRDRRDVTIKTDIGELHEYYLGVSDDGVLNWWRMEHFIKKPSDYRILMRALEHSRFELDDSKFIESEQNIKNRGITLAVADRTPFLKIQIDYAGIERFSYDYADQVPELFELLDLMNELILDEFQTINQSQVEYVKLWENIYINAVGPQAYRTQIVPVYEKILDMFSRTGKNLIVHYDGKNRLISEDIKRLGFDIDSFTPPPEGDMTTKEARNAWPDTFLWLHPSLTWFELPAYELASKIRQMIKGAGPYKYSFEISEGVPQNWKESIPVVLKTLQQMSDF